MIVPQDWTYNTDKEIAYDEYDVIDSFLDQYRGKDVIVADKHREDFSVVPFSGESVTFKSNKSHWKCVDFQRRIMRRGKPYVVRLGLWRVNPQDDDPKCLTIRSFNILTPGQQHVLNFSTDDYRKNRLLYNILDIFDESKIISPEEAYSRRMYTNTQLQDFIRNREWGKITEGINQKPCLANALFIIGEPHRDLGDFRAEFGTILYHLIAYRKAYENLLSKRELLELDRIILELEKVELLRVKLRDDTCFSKVYPSGSTLLDWRYHGSQMRISEQETVDNGELEEEAKVFRKVINESKGNQ